MEQAVPHMLLIFETEPPGPLLLARLSQYDADLVPSQKFDFELGPPNLRIYGAILVYTPGNLRRGHFLCDRLRSLASTPILLIAPIKAADEACRALQESVDVLLPPKSTLLSWPAILLRSCVVIGCIAPRTRKRTFRHFISINTKTWRSTSSGAPSRWRADLCVSHPPSFVS